jgi:CMP-N-acetylneuraminic acid synthetase
MKSCVDIMRSGNHDSVITATRFTRFLGYLGAKSKKWIPVYPYRFLRQEYDPPFFIENGGVYLATRGLWGSGRRMGTQCGVVLMDWWESLEIDEPEDLEVARAIAKHYIKE